MSPSTLEVSSRRRNDSIGNICIRRLTLGLSENSTGQVLGLHMDDEDSLGGREIPPYSTLPQTWKHLAH